MTDQEFVKEVENVILNAIKSVADKTALQVISVYYNPRTESVSLSLEFKKEGK